MSYDVFTFVTLRPPEAVKDSDKKSFTPLASLSHTEAVNISRDLAATPDTANIKALVKKFGIEKSLTALVKTGAKANVINQVIEASKPKQVDQMVVMTTHQQDARGSILESLHINRGRTFFDRRRRRGSVLDEGDSGNVLAEGSDNVLSEGPMPATPAVPEDPESSFFRPVGVGELEVVQQELRGYEMGEIAYIENVLASEFRERLHKQTHESETTYFEEEELEDYMEQDLQAVERFELQAASKEELSQRSKLETSLDVSGSYGPTVEVKAGLKFSMENSKAQSQQRASEFAQEVTERAIRRTQSRIKTARTEITRHRTEQSNVHRFDNTGDNAEHVAGVYRYVDKIYNMRLVNRGIRFFYEFYIPSPGAYLRSLMQSSASGPAQPPLPARPNITIDSITPATYKSLAKRYGVHNLPVPPQGTITLTETASDRDSGAGGSQRISKEGALSIDKGYEVDSATVTITAFRQHSTDPEAWVTLGSETKAKINGWPALTASGDATVFTFAKAKGQRGSLGYSLYARHDSTVQFVVQVDCKPTEEALTAWQHKVYDLIQDHYQSQLSDAKAAQANSFSGSSETDFLDLPDQRLREIERDELRRLCLQLIGSEAQIAEQDALGEGPGDMPLVMEANEGPMDEGGRMPIDRALLDPLASEVRFAEQAFEWANMSYTLYPYFWNEPAYWDELLSLDHPDPLHGKFLRAGMARVLLPVRPNYEEAVRDFLYRGRAALKSNEPANITDPRWLPLHQEMREATQRRQEGDKLVDTWLTRLSTSLVMLDATVKPDEHGRMMQRSDEE